MVMMGHRYRFLSLIQIIMVCCGTTNVFANITEIRSGNYSIGENITIDNTGGYVGGVLSVVASPRIINNGIITSDITICDNCDLYVQNRGTFDASVTLGSGATLTQIITTAADITELSNVGVAYGVAVTDTPDVLPWENILNKTHNATGVTLSNAKLQMNTLSVTHGVTLNGNVFIYTDYTPSGDDLLFTDVSGDGVVYVVSNNLDALYSLETYRKDNNVFMHTVRATDYARILNNGAGRFLNNLRLKSPDDKLLQRMDTAQTRGALDKIMSHSVRLNPIKLMQPVHVLYSHKTLEIMHIDDDVMFGIKPIMIFSSDMNVRGVEPSVNINIFDNLALKVFARIADMEYTDDINEYGAMHYATGIDAIYNFPMNYFARTYAEFSLSTFDSGMVFDGTKTVENPNGYSAFGMVEFGRRFDFNDGYYVSPFIFADADYANVLNDNDTDIRLGAGGNVGYGFVFDGLRYDYAARAIVGTGGCGAAINISAFSIADNAGADLGIGIFNDDIIGTSYNISLKAKFNF